MKLSKISLCCMLAPSIFSTSLFFAGCSRNAKEYNKIFIGNVETMDESNPTAEAIVVKDGKIEYVGSKEEALKYRDTNTQFYDFTGKTIYPGFMDGHSHAMKFAGTLLSGCKLDRTDTFQECVGKLRGFIGKHPDYECYEGFGWQRQTDSDGKTIEPDYQYLEQVTKEIDNKWIVLNSEDQHSVWVNKPVLEYLGIDAEYAKQFDPDHKLIHVFPEGHAKVGQPTGVLLDDYHVLVNSILPTSKSELIDSVHALEEASFTEGYTTINDGAIYEYSTSPLVSTLGEMGLDKSLKLRIFSNYYIVEFVDWAEKMQQLQNSYELAKKYNSDHFKVVGTKVFIDGTTEGGNSLLIDPYNNNPDGSDTDYYGLNRWFEHEDELKYIVKWSNERGMSVHFHTVGDQASELALKTIIDADKDIEGDHDFRNTLLHLQLVSQDSIQKMKENKVIAAVAPLWTPIGETYGPIEEQYLGSERVNQCYPIQSLMDEDITCVYHTDNPVSTLLEEEEKVGYIISQIYLASHRDYWWQRSGMIHPRKNQAQEIVKDRYDSIKAMTTNVAYEFGVEDKLGTIEKGKLADFTVFTNDLLSCSDDDLLKTKVASTIVDGNVVYYLDVD